MKLINVYDDSIETIRDVYGYSKIPDKVNHYLLYVDYSSVGLERLIVVQEVAGSTPVSHPNRLGSLVVTV